VYLISLEPNTGGKMLKQYLCFMLVIILFRGGFAAVHLSDVYQQAEPGAGYDKLLVLEQDSVYTGGLSISNIRVAIRGNGALINLQNGSIIISGEAQLDLDGCVIINGSYAISVNENDNVSSFINQCTFYNNNIAIRFMTKTGNIEIVNTILMNNSAYGFACSHETSRMLHYIDAYGNEENYVEWCPG